jgi:hypothetical protein
VNSFNLSLPAFSISVIVPKKDLISE